jgi:mannose-6-phosphate isomerase-like protein (cupin superfamily)
METIFDYTKAELNKQGFNEISHDFTRPWGGFFVIDESQADTFAQHFFIGVTADGLRIGGKLSPKILLVKPGHRLSWQYHHRRAEIWRVVEGQVAVMLSQTDEPGEIVILNPGDQITLACGERHRLIGLTDWAVIAEIWQHTNPAHPSNEEDIVRLQDDYGR